MRWVYLIYEECPTTPLNQTPAEYYTKLRYAYLNRKKAIRKLDELGWERYFYRKRRVEVV